MEITKAYIIKFFSKPYNKIKFYEYYLASYKEEGCYYQYICHCMQYYITNIFDTLEFIIYTGKSKEKTSGPYFILLEDLLPDLFAAKTSKSNYCWFLDDYERIEAIKNCLKVLKEKENQKKELEIIRTIIIISAIAIIYLLYKTIS
jgi:hypothetical protein